MRVHFFSILALLILIIGCSPTGKSKNIESNSTNTPMEQSLSIPMGKAKYEKLYFDYRTLITEAINSTNINLYRVTNEYITKTGNTIVTISVSTQDSMGYGTSVLYIRDRTKSYPIKMIHYINPFVPVHVSKLERFIRCTSGMTTNRTYLDNIHIKMVIEPEFQKLLTSESSLPQRTPTNEVEAN